MINMSNPGEQLLNAMSAWGNFDLQKYYLGFNEIGLAAFANSPARQARGRYLRALEALALCDVDYQDRRIQVIEPAIALLKGVGCPRAILTGGRSPMLISDLVQGAQEFDISVKQEAQHVDDMPLPNAVYLDAPRCANLQALCTRLRVSALLDEPASWLIVHATADLARYENALEWGPVPMLPDGVAEEFDVSIIQGVRRRFQGNIPPKRLLSYADPTTTLLQTWWVEQGQAARVDLDWGRYLALKSASRHIFYFNPVQQQLSIPAGVPLPGLFARALTLCSGHVPQTVELIMPGFAKKTWFIVYTEVPQSIVQIIAEKLGQIVRLSKGKKK